MGAFTIIICGLKIKLFRKACINSNYLFYIDFYEILTQIARQFPMSVKLLVDWAGNDKSLILFVVDNKVSTPDKFLLWHLNPLNVRMDISKTKE
jgi:hypothetical protein